MEIKDQRIELGKDEDGNDIITEIEQTVEFEEPDGTEVSAEITSTADPDDPTDIETTISVTETAPDGTVTETEYVVSDEGVVEVEDESLAEQALEAILGVELEEVDSQTAEIQPESVDASPEIDEISLEDYSEVEADEDFASQNSIEFNLGRESFDPNAEQADDDIFEPETFDAAETEEEHSVEEIEQEEHARAAEEAQAAADEFVEAGDYEAAAEAREAAENEAWEAGDNSMLDGSDSSELDYAADRQEEAEYYEAQQAEHLREGDYEAAREDAQNAGYATGDADFMAGGDDHTGQSDMDEYNLDNAVWHERFADENARNAEKAAEEGDVYAAEMYADDAASEQTMADDFAVKADPGNIMADYDPSSEVASGGSYDAGMGDDLSGIDTGFEMDQTYDAGMVSDYDSGLDSGIDTGMDTGFDPGLDTGGGEFE
ncbi:MAG: hypothetical protein R2684_05285 [Pyrinomonadaceae bacterium]